MLRAFSIGWIFGHLVSITFWAFIIVLFKWGGDGLLYFGFALYEIFGFYFQYFDKLKQSGMPVPIFYTSNIPMILKTIGSVIVIFKLVSHLV